MFIDASAVVAILAREPGHEELEKRLSSEQGPFFVSPLVVFEAAMALARMKAPAGTRPTPALIEQGNAAVTAFIAALPAEQIAITAEIGAEAIVAGASYGKVTGHPADLNFGDCFAYACAKTLGAPLLYKGNDFARTDLA